jgi:MFS superfamily sulfate permease-like transporter
VAVIMIAGQLDTLAGVPVESDRPLRQIWEFITHLGELRGPTLALGTAVLVFLFVMGWRFPKLPVPLIAILAATAAVKLFDLGGGDLELVGAVPSGLPTPALPNVSLDDVLALLLPAVGVTVVGYTDNILDGRAFANRGGYSIDPNQELLALSGSNAAAGMLHGFPVSSSGSRTVIGVSLGARTQLAGLVAAAVVVATLLVFSSLLESFPRAALSAVVIWAAVKLVDVAEFRRIARFRRSELVLALATTAAVLLTDILYGVLIAVGLSVLDVVRRVARPHDGVLGYVPGLAGMHDVDDYPEARQVPGLVVYRYDAPLFFANAEDFRARAIEALDEADGAVEWVLLNFEANVHIDLTSVDALDALRADLDARGITLALARVKHEMHAELDQAGLLDRIGADRVFATLPTAVLAYASWYEAAHGHRPEGFDPPPPPAAPRFD